MTSVRCHMTSVGCHMTSVKYHMASVDVTWLVWKCHDFWCTSHDYSMIVYIGMSLIKDLKMKMYWFCTPHFLPTAQSSYASPLVFPAFDKQILQPIRAIKTLDNNNIKFRTFICLAMSKGMLSDWLEALPKQKGKIVKFYTRSQSFYHVLWCILMCSWAVGLHSNIQQMKSWDIFVICICEVHVNKANPSIH